MLMTDEELKDLVASLAVAQRETDRQLKETDRQLKETDRQLRKQLKELGKQIGGLGEKFGGFTEGHGVAFNDQDPYRRLWDGGGHSSCKST